MKETQTPQLHVGEMLRKFYKGKKISMTEIGRAMGVKGSTIIYHHKRAELNTGIILKYSMILRHNFFLDLAAMLPKDFTTNAPQAEAELALIAALQEELKTIKDDFRIVKAERDLLKDIMGSK
jgi:DNA-binding Lrp family transcriptional regulator